MSGVQSKSVASKTAPPAKAMTPKASPPPAKAAPKVPPTALTTEAVDHEPLTDAGHLSPTAHVQEPSGSSEEYVQVDAEVTPNVERAPTIGSTHFHIYILQSTQF